MRSVPITEDAPESPAAPFRERIATRNEEHAREYPQAATKESEVLSVLHEALNGDAVAFRGTRSAQGFRAALLGDKNFTLSDLCRLATSPTREARAATKAALTVLAASIGYRLESAHPDVPDAHEALAGVVESFGTFGSQMSRDLRDDGRIDHHEARALRPALEQLKAGVTRAEAVIVAAEQSGR
jgi:hypothetical protein